MDKLRAIASFCSTVEAKSFVAAARVLDVTPSALSKLIGSLEQDPPAMLLTAGLDIILRVSDMADSGLVARKLGSAEFVVCASPAYLRVMGTPKQPQDLSKHEAIIYARPDEEPSTNWRFTRGDTRLVVSVPIRLVMRDGVGGIDAAIKGCGIVRSFEITTREAVASGQLSRLLSDWSTGSLSVFAVYPGSRAVPAKVQAFVEFVQQILS